jgi:ribosomal protein L18
MKKKVKKIYLQQKKRSLKKIIGTPEKPRLAIFRSHKHIYAQLIDDKNGHTLACSSTLDKNIALKVKSTSTKEASFFVGETIAQKAKEKTKFTSIQIEDFKRGFLVKGLFRFSRHPNFFAEISLWWVIYAFSISSQYSKIKNNFEYSLLFNYSMVGPFFLTLLFHGSTDLTENISLTKYPKYAEYQSRVSRLIPFLIIPSRKAVKNE